jgi:hypothetical protein
LSKNQPPPLNERVADESGFMTMPWQLYNNQQSIGDTGTDFAARIAGLTNSGDYVLSGRVYRISQALKKVRMKIDPTGTTSSVLGTTYIFGFPFEISSDDVCFVAIPPTAGLGTCVAASNRIYLPAWADIPVPVTITAFLEAR